MKHRMKVPPARQRERPSPQTTHPSSSKSFSVLITAHIGTSATSSTPWCTTYPSLPAATSLRKKATAQEKICRRKDGHLWKICAHCVKHWIWEGQRGFWRIPWGPSGSSWTRCACWVYLGWREFWLNLVSQGRGWVSFKSNYSPSLVKFKCLGTPKVLDLDRSWSNPNRWISSNFSLFSCTMVFKECELLCWINSNLLLFLTVDLNLCKERELSCQISSDSLLFIHRIDLHTHTHTYMHTCTHTRTHTHTFLDTCRCQVSITVNNQSLNDLWWSKQYHRKEFSHPWGETPTH